MSCQKKQSLVIKNQEFIQFLCNLSPTSRSKLITSLGGQYINTISEICNNFLKKNLTQDSKVIRKILPYKKDVREVALKKNPIYKKKRILQSQRGGAILSILLPLAVGLISSLLK